MGRSDFIDVDDPGVAFDDVTDDGETQSGASCIARPCFVETGEAFEDELAILDRDTVAIVAHGEPCSAVAFGEGDRDGGGCVPFGVLDKVASRPCKLLGVADGLYRGDFAKVDGHASAFSQAPCFAEDDVVEVDAL